LTEAYTHPDWSRVRAVIFDIDGTLYHQQRLRVRMFAEALTVNLKDRFRTFRVIHRFRRNREDLAERLSPNAAALQYALVAERLGLSKELVAATIREWMFERPLRHLPGSRRPGVLEFIQKLRDRGMRVAVLSDYPVDAKLAALGIVCDVAYYTLEAPDGSLKPSPKGLRAVVGLLGLRVDECVMIGDRVDRDGAMASSVGMPFLLCDRSRFFVDLAKTV